MCLKGLFMDFAFVYTDLEWVYAGKLKWFWKPPHLLTTIYLVDPL